MCIHTHTHTHSPQVLRLLLTVPQLKIKNFYEISSKIFLDSSTGFGEETHNIRFCISGCKTPETCMFIWASLLFSRENVHSFYLIFKVCDPFPPIFTNIYLFLK